MKKIKVIFLIMCICLLASCTSTQESGFVKMNGSEVVDKITNLESFVLMITNEDSYACDVFVEESKMFLEENNIVIYTIYENDVDESTKEQLKIALGEYMSWPALFYIKEGTLSNADKYEYSKDPEGWKTWMENMGLIAKEN